MKTSHSLVISIIAHRAAGNGVRQTAKLCGVSTATVQRWSLLVGQGCARVLDRMFRDLRVHRLELDEMHSYVHTRQRHLRADAHPDHGDVWLYLAEDVVSRAIVLHAMGKRNFETTDAFVHQLRARTVGRVQIATDGYPAYVAAIERWFGDDVDYASVVKEYESARGAKGLLAADRYVSSTRTAILGHPDSRTYGTSHVERLNGTFRAGVSKLGRRTLKQAKSLLRLLADVALRVAVYNSVDIHGTTKTTPAVSLGLTDHPWSLAELIEAALAEPEPSPLLPVVPPAPPRRPPAATRERAPTPLRPRNEKGPTPREARVLEELRRADELTIAALAARAFPEVTPEATANSWVRNQLRGLLAMSLIEKVGRGTYRATARAGEGVTTDQRLAG